MDIVFVFIGIIFLFGVLLWFLKPRKKISPQVLKKSTKQIQNTKKLAPNHALMESHKIFISAIATLYPKEKKLNAAKLVSRVCKRFPNEKTVWHLHRLRNKSAHEVNFKIYEKTKTEAIKEFVRALKSLK